jgi:rhomboid protease GluP
VQWALMLIGINLAFGLIVPRIDWLAHAGGLVAGVVAGFAAEGVGRRAARTASQVTGLIVLVLGSAALVAWRAAALTA